LAKSVFSSEALDRLIFNGSKVKLQPHILDPLIFSDVILIDWSGLKQGFDRLIQCWSWSQTFLSTQDIQVTTIVGTAH